MPLSRTAPAVAADRRIPSYRLREVVPSDQQAVAWAAHLHAVLFKDMGLIAMLGERILRRFCYTVLVRDGLMKAVVFEVDGQPAGLMAYTTDSQALHRAAFGSHVGVVVREVLLSLLTSPMIVLGFPGAARLIWERRNERIEGGALVAETLAMGVMPAFRTPEFVRQTGLRVGDRLLAHALADLKLAGVREARGVVLADNHPAIAYFRMRAVRVNPYPNAGKPSLEFWYDVDKPPRV